MKSVPDHGACSDRCVGARRVLGRCEFGAREATTESCRTIGKRTASSYDGNLWI